jgi:CheY-like chemotaxis protein
MPHTRPCILLVDDEDENLVLLEAMLERFGANLFVARSGSEALAMAHELAGTLDAVLLDRRMPGWSGLELARRFAAEPGLAPIPLIFQTAAGDRRELREGIDAGGLWYLTKPFDREVLVSVLRSAIERHRTWRDASLQSAPPLADEVEFTFARTAPCHALAARLATDCAAMHLVRLGLAELLLNAVEHGLLGAGFTRKRELLQNGGWTQWLAEHEARIAPDRVASVSRRCGTDVVEFEIVQAGAGYDAVPDLIGEPGWATAPNGRGLLRAERSLGPIAVSEQGRRIRVTARRAA